MDRKSSSFARSFFQASGDGSEELQLDDSVPVPRSRPMGRMASRRNLQIKRPSVAPSLAAAAAAASAGGGGGPVQRGVGPTKSGDSLASASASLASRSSFSSPPVAVAAAPPRNAEENWLRQSMMRSSGVGGGGGNSGNAESGFDMQAIRAAAEAVGEEDGALNNNHNNNNMDTAGFDDEEVLEQYRIMAQHEAMLRVKANTGFDVEEYEKRRKDPSAGGKDPKDKKRLYGGGKKPKLGLPPPQPVLSLHSNHSNHNSTGIERPILPLSISACTGPSANYTKFLEDQQQRAESLPEMSKGEVVRNTQMVDGDHVVRCWGCRVNLRVNYVATLVQCPACQTVSQARKRS